MEVKSVPLDSCSTNDLIGIVVFLGSLTIFLGCIVYALWRAFRG